MWPWPGSHTQTDKRHRNTLIFTPRIHVPHACNSEHVGARRKIKPQSTANTWTPLVGWGTDARRTRSVRRAAISRPYYSQQHFVAWGWTNVLAMLCGGRDGGNTGNSRGVMAKLLVLFAALCANTQICTSIKQSNKHLSTRDHQTTLRCMCSVQLANGLFEVLRVLHLRLVLQISKPQRHETNTHTQTH